MKNAEISIITKLIRQDKLIEDCDFFSPTFYYQCGGGSIYVQFQDTESLLHDKLNCKCRPRVSTHTWARVWIDDKLVFKCEEPKYLARQSVIRFLESLKKGENHD